MHDSLKFSSEVAEGTLSIHAALVLELLQERSQREGDMLEIDYKGLFPEMKGYMDNRLFILITLKRLESDGFGELIFEGRTRRFFKLYMDQYFEPDLKINKKYVTGIGIRRGLIHDIMVRKFGDGGRIDIHEAALVKMLLEETNDVVSEQTVLKTFHKLVTEGYLSFTKGSNKGIPYKERKGYKIYKVINAL
ncbi:hypothetical protein [Bacillus sp. COPE52]|uniref:hypothetical protein n=1 Tax=Bacillus sp. COPE52 TaxID=2233998 RepID=UPI000E101C31|nr:hypothetical protein [Bacillus sp. COPE52]AXK19154.1 hypothetical protein DPQ31_16220 [Bacillus sp. COPE52]